MGKKAQIIIISLWVLVILAMLAISISQRVSLALRLSRYQQNKLKSMYLAKAGINLAINELLKDDKNCDSLPDKWADNAELFKEITFGGDKDGFASVSYINWEGREVFGVIDEESKININKSEQALLEVLLYKTGIANFAELAENICAWRGGGGATVDYGDLGYPNKAAKFSNTQELILVKGFKDMPQESYDKLKGLITVYGSGSGKVNINTADSQVLEVLIEYSKKKLQDQGNSEHDPGDLLARIIQARPFLGTGDFNERIKNQGSPGAGQINILNELDSLIDFKSSCFSIHSGGKIKNVNSEIHCIFDREKEKIVYWHES